jgi:serine/threonine protein kinase
MRRASSSERSISDCDGEGKKPDPDANPAIVVLSQAEGYTTPRGASSRGSGPVLPRRENPLEASPVNGSLSRPSPPSSSQDPIIGVQSAATDLFVRRGHLIGRGAFGSVYLGLNMANSQLVAIKQIRLAESNDSVVRSIQREMDVMMRLPPHPNVVRYFGHRESNRHISIIMEYVSGGSVASLYNAVGVFHEATVRRYATMALKGLSHLHRNGIVHQDIKGANVLADADGVAKIADFGCCRDLTLVTGSVKAAGTPLWMAPEVCAGSRSTTMSDIWSFGCFILEMVKPDHLPWSNLGGGFFAVMYAIGNATKPPSLPDKMSVEGKAFVSRCLAIDPSSRATAEELLDHPWIRGPHTDTWDTFEDNLMPSATQTVMTDFTTCSLKDIGSDTDDDGSLAAGDDDDDEENGHVLRVPAAVMSPLSNRSRTDAYSPRSDAGDGRFQNPVATRPQPVVWRSGGHVEVGTTDPKLVAQFAEMTPSDSSPIVKGRRKLGEKRRWYQKLFGW